MKKKFLLLPIIGVFAYVTLTSSASGGAFNSGADGTKATGTSNTCGGCHGSNASTTVVIELDSAGVPVTHYTPGMAYTIKITGTNTSTTATLPKFGFQTTVVKATGAGTSSAVLAGSFPTTGLPTGTRYTSAAAGCGIDVLEHSSSHTATTGTGASGTTYVISGLPWTAPAAGTGNVVVYGCINAVNGMGNQGGDIYNSSSLAISERVVSHVGVNNVVAADSKMYPNPVSNVLNLSGYNGVVTVFDMNGKVIATENVADTAVINTSNWASGAYFVTVNNNGAVTTKTIVKQ